MNTSSHPPPRHRLADDLQGLVTGTLFVALGVLMYQHAGLLTGGTAGLAFLIHYATGLDFGPVYFAVNLPFCLLGGLLMGAGMLMLFRHQSSLSGFNVVALMLQQRRGWRAGHVQLGMDAAVLLPAMAVTDGPRVLWSTLGAVALNLALSFNHRPGRYLAA